jgi:phosphocarrier protein HPr
MQDQASYKDELCELVVIENQKGLHARAAARFVRTAETFQADINVVAGDMRVSGRSIMGLMMLAATCGTQLKLYASGDDAESAIVVLSDLVKRRFDEDE